MRNSIFSSGFGTHQTILLVSVAMLCTGVLQAQTQEGSSKGKVLEEVFVTAGKRTQSIADIAGAISAMSGDQLEEMGAKTMEDYLKLIPGVALPTSQFGPDSSPPIVRGIAVRTGFGNLGAPASQTTGVFIDDVPYGGSLTSLQFPDVNPFDLERVEVLKGPQGTLYGAQALAGAIRFITRKPQVGEWEAKFQGSVTSVEHSEDVSPFTALALNVPVGESAAIRAVGLYREGPGHIDVVSRGDPPAARQEKDVNYVIQKAGRILGKWDISPKLTVSGLYMEQKTRQHDFGASDTEHRYERGLTPFHVPTFQEFSLANFSLEYDFGWALLLSSTSRKTQDSILPADLTGGFGSGLGGTECNPNDPNDDETGPCEFPGEGPGPEDQNSIKIVDVNFASTVEGYSQEFRLVSPDEGKWRWVAGLSYQEDETFTIQRSFFASGDSVPDFSQVPTVDSVLLGPINLSEFSRFQDASADTTAQEVAAFGEVTRELGERWELTLGGRYFRTSFDALVVRRSGFEVAQASEPGNPNTVEVLDTSTEEKGFNPRASVLYRVADNVTTYALASKGFQFGGTQLTPQIAGQDIPPTFKSSTIWNYEIGARTDWFEKRLSVDLTYFELDWTDLQITSSTEDPSGLDTIRFFFVDNVGGAESKGYELAIRAIPFDGVTVTSSMSKIDAVTTEPFRDTATNSIVPPGTRLPASPEFQMANSISYSKQFPAWTPTITLTHAYIGKIFNNLVQDQEAGDYDTFDLSLRMQKMNSRYLPFWSLSVNNLMDELGPVNADGTDAQRGINYVHLRPRAIEFTFGMQLDGASGYSGSNEDMPDWYAGFARYQGAYRNTTIEEFNVNASETKRSRITVDGNVNYGLLAGVSMSDEYRFEGEYRIQEHKFDGKAPEAVGSELKTKVVNLNVWRDFDLNDALKPYVGVGFGLGTAELGDMNDNIFLLQAGFGVNWLFAEHLALDVGWRYQTAERDVQFERDGFTDTLNLRGHNLAIGVTYNFKEQ